MADRIVTMTVNQAIELGFGKFFLNPRLQTFDRTPPMDQPDTKTSQYQQSLRREPGVLPVRVATNRGNRNLQISIQNLRGTDISGVQNQLNISEGSLEQAFKKHKALPQGTEMGIREHPDLQRQLP